MIAVLSAGRISVTKCRSRLWMKCRLPDIDACVKNTALICHELPYLAPVAAAGRLRARPGFAFLDGDGGPTGRYAFIGTDPFGIFTIRQGVAFWNDQQLSGPPLDHLREHLARYTIDPDPRSPPLRAGCIGHIAYDFGQHLEKLDPPQQTTPSVSDMRFAFYDVIHAFDLHDKRAWLFSSGLPEPKGKGRIKRAERRMADTLDHLRAPGPAERPASAVGNWRSNFTADGYIAAVEVVKNHIRNGDIYQANIAQRYEAALPDDFDTWAFYQNLRNANPAPFAAYLQDGPNIFASSSPERFLSLRNGLAEARPIKGTMRRAASPEEDARLAETLLASEKDRAENIMIVDLLRNDLSRVCKPGTVAVPMLCGLESYAAVHHLTSVVHGRLRDGLGAVDLIAACFPGGSVTGAPKLRAMDIITKLEQQARGVYCGAIGYIGFDGGMDLNIAIRTATLGAGRAVFQAGGGVTLLSDGAAEYAETLTKAQRLFAAFGAGADTQASVHAADHR